MRTGNLTRKDQEQNHEHVSSEQEGAHQVENSEHDSEYESAQGGSQISEEPNLPPEDDYDLLQRQQEPETETSKREKRGPGRPKGAKKEPPPPPQLQLRLRSRVTDLAMFATLDPQTYQEAHYSLQSEQWQKAIEEEIEALTKNNTWTLVDKLPPERTVFQSRWVFKKKMNTNGTLDRTRQDSVLKAIPKETESITTRPLLQLQDMNP
jgi:hypothetical protein